MSRELQKIVREPSQIRFALEWVDEMVKSALRGGDVRISLGRPKRTLDQNAKLWPMLEDVSKQVEWYSTHLTKEEWKDVFTASLKGQKAVPGIEGGFVVLGAHTSKMDKETFSNLVELIYAFGAEHEVEWTEPKKETVT